LDLVARTVVRIASSGWRPPKVPPTAFSGNGGGRFPSSVMPGPDPGIHLSKKMDYRVFITKTRFAL